MQNRKQTNLLILTGTNDAIKCSKGKAEKLSHRLSKFWLANYCWEHELDFATEAVFHDNQRADFVVKDWNIAIEILGTEKIKDFINKSYPLPTIPISATMNQESIEEMMNDLKATNGAGWCFYLKKHTNIMTKKGGR